MHPRLHSDPARYKRSDRELRRSRKASEALGATVDWGDRNKMPDCRNFLYEDFSDIKVPEDFLEKPSMRVLLDAISILRRHVGGKAAIIGKAMGPWTLSYHMAGTQNFLLRWDCVN